MKLFASAFHCQVCIWDLIWSHQLEGDIVKNVQCLPVLSAINFSWRGSNVVFGFLEDQSTTLHVKLTKLNHTFFHRVYIYPPPHCLKCQYSIRDEDGSQDDIGSNWHMDEWILFGRTDLLISSHNYKKMKHEDAVWWWTVKENRLKVRLVSYPREHSSSSTSILSDKDQDPRNNRELLCSHNRVCRENPVDASTHFRALNSSAM